MNFVTFFQGTFKKAVTFILLFVAALFFTLGFYSCASIPNTKTPENTSYKHIGIGYGKSGSLYLVKERGNLEKKLSTSGFVVKWVEINNPSDLIQGINSGHLDLGYFGDGPLIFGLASGLPLVYVANTPPSPQSIAILVHKDSPIQSIADLKGKRVTFNRGASTQVLVVRALQSVGLKYTDIQPVILKTPDSSAAFETGDVDAWSVQDPWLAVAQHRGGSRILTDGTGLITGGEFYATTRDFATKNPKAIEVIISEINKVGIWAKQHPRQVAEFLSQPMGIDTPSLEVAERRRKRYGVQMINDEVISAQQKIADDLLRLNLIPKPVKVADAVWKPK